MQINHSLSKLLSLVVVVLVFFSCSTENDMNLNMSDGAPGFVTYEVGEAIPGQYIVTFHESPASHQALQRTTGYVERNAIIKEDVASLLSVNEIANVQINQVYANSVIGFSGRFDAHALAALRKDSRVKSIEQDRYITLKKPDHAKGGGNGNGGGNNKDDGGSDDGGSNDGGSGGDSGGSTGSGSSTTQPGQTIPWGIQRVGYGDGTGKTAWIIDTGIELNHPDLNVDANRSRTFAGGTPNDMHGHGTHVAGIIGAKNNSIGVVGVAANATLVAVKVFSDNGSGSLTTILNGVDYVAANAKAGDVVNMSIGGGANSTLDNAVKNLGAKGIFVAIAAGNSGANANNFSPARATGTNLWTVSAMGVNDLFEGWSNHGNPPIRFCQPGTGINSTYLNGTYTMMSGTSMAAPHLAGLLLITNGNPRIGGYVKNDPDGTPDPIAVK